MGKSKPMTDMLDDNAKARLLGGYVSSGSEHEGGDLSGFVDGIFFSDEDDAAGDAGEDEEKNLEVSDTDEGWLSLPFTAAAMVHEMLKPVVEDSFHATLTAHATAAAEQLSALRRDRSEFRRAVMSSLRDSGFNAGVCKARWEGRGGLTGGSYEYIDVVVEEAHQNPRRYVVDVHFGGEFEIARPTEEYERVAGQLPGVYVGKTEELRRLLRLLADAAKRSLQSRAMPVPPWRKGRYMQAKWLGAYRRSTNPNPSSFTAPPALVSHQSKAAGREVKCRLVGFDAAPILAVLPAATRAR